MPPQVRSRGVRMKLQLQTISFLAVLFCSCANPPDQCGQAAARLFEPCGDVALCFGGPFGTHLTMATGSDGGSSSTACVTTRDCTVTAECVELGRQGSCVLVTPVSSSEYSIGVSGGTVSACVLECTVEGDCPMGGHCSATGRSTAPQRVCVY